MGGFAASDWLYKQVSEALKEKGFSVVRPDHHVLSCPLVLDTSSTDLFFLLF